MFQTLQLNEDILSSLEKNGFTDPTEIQEKTIPLLLQGKDLIGRSQTGSGKTLAYALPIIQNVDTSNKVVQALIVCPTRELASQVADEIHKITGNMENVKTTAIFGGSNMDRQIKALKQGTSIVVGTPGRIMDHLKRKTLKLHNLKTVVLDEADEMLNMGFREDIETILKTTQKTRQTVMFSATMPKAILDITKNYMNNPITVEIGQNNNVVNTIEQSFIADKDKQHVLLDLLLTYQPKQCIIFCNTKRMVDTVVSSLQKSNIAALGLHGDKRQNERKKIMSEIKKIGNVNVLVATDVAARGIDIKDVDYVINYDIPQTTEYYVHRIGRTARAGKKGKAITLINTRSQADHLREIEREIGVRIPEVNVRGELIIQSNKSRPRKDNSSFDRMPKNMQDTGKASRKYSDGTGFNRRKEDPRRSSTRDNGQKSYATKNKENGFAKGSKPKYQKDNYTSDYGRKPSYNKRNSSFDFEELEPSEKSARRSTFHDSTSKGFSNTRKTAKNTSIKKNTSHKPSATSNGRSRINKDA